MSGAGGVAGDRLRSIVERIERLEEEIKALREVVRLRKQDKNEREERDSLLDVYLHAIETAPAALAKAA